MLQGSYIAFTTTDETASRRTRGRPAEKVLEIEGSEFAVFNTPEEAVSALKDNLSMDDDDEIEFAICRVERVDIKRGHKSTILAKAQTFLTPEELEWLEDQIG